MIDQQTTDDNNTNFSQAGIGGTGGDGTAFGNAAIGGRGGHPGHMVVEVMAAQRCMEMGQTVFSIVTPNRDRLEHLKQAVQTWQNKTLVAEIIVVDYGSTPPIRHDDFEDAEKIRIIRVEGTADWRIGHASNIGFDFASNRYIIKLDADVLIECDE